MPKVLYSNKRMDSTVVARIILVSAILLLDITLLPWLLKFPFFLFGDDIVNAPNLWIAYGPLKAWKDIISIKAFRNLFLYSQLPVGALILAIAWNTDRLRKRNRIKDGIGGPDPSGAGQHGTSRWQNKHEMDQTCNVWHTDLPIKSAGTIYGMEKSRSGDEKVWYNKEDLHTLLVAATRSGKSRKIFLPTIWTLAQAGESMVIGDPKGELYIAGKEWLENKGYKVIALNFREPAKGNQWNLLELVNRAVDEGNIPRATELAWDIANTITNQKPATSSEPIWTNGEESTIAALILLTCIDSEFKFQRHMTTAYYLLAEYGQPLDDESIPLLDYIKKLPVRHPAKSAFATANIAPYKTRASFFTTALADLRLFSDPNISDMTARSDHQLDSVGIEKTAVFLIVPDEKATRNVLATLYIDQLYQSLVDLANRSGGRIARRVNFLLDEFGNLPPIPEFDKKLTVAGGRGMRFTLAVQDIAQLKKLYKENSQTITGNCHVWIYLKTKDIETSKIISEMTGKYTVATENTSSTVQSKGHSSTVGEGLTGRPLLTDDEVRRWDIEESLVFPMSYFPARYPLPDLSFWRANIEYGFVATGNIDEDKELNRRIVEDRWNRLYTRPINEISIWLPEILEEEPVKEVKKQQLKKERTEEVNVPGQKEFKKVTSEVVTLMAEKDDNIINIPDVSIIGKENEAEKVEKEAKPISLRELKLDNILKTAAADYNSKTDEEEDFI